MNNYYNERKMEVRKKLSSQWIFEVGTSRSVVRLATTTAHPSIFNEEEFFWKHGAKRRQYWDSCSTVSYSSAASDFRIIKCLLSWCKLCWFSKQNCFANIHTHELARLALALIVCEWKWLQMSVININRKINVHQIIHPMVSGAFMQLDQPW